MENNEEKKGCCENKEGSMTCCHGMSNCCHNWRRCHMMRKIIMIIVIIIAFCLGSQWGEMRNERWGNDRFERGGMMNWGYGKFAIEGLLAKRITFLTHIGGVFSS